MAVRTRMQFGEAAKNEIWPSSCRKSLRFGILHESEGIALVLEKQISFHFWIASKLVAIEITGLHWKRYSGDLGGYLEKEGTHVYTPRSV